MSKDFPTGLAFFNLLEEKIFSKCTIQTQDYIKQDRFLNLRVEKIGTLFSYVSRLSECYWGCKHQNHLREYILGKACNSFSASWILLLKGHYDASWSALREIAEITNLFMLFSFAPETFIEWESIPDKERKAKYSPYKVRRALEERNIPVPIDKDLYSKLSERFVHITPQTRPDLHSNSDRPVASGTFQKEGVENTIKFMSYFLSQLCLSSVIVLNTDKLLATQLITMAEELKK